MNLATWVRLGPSFSAQLGPGLSFALPWQNFILNYEVLPVGGGSLIIFNEAVLCSGAFFFPWEVPLRPYRTYVGFFFG